MGYFLGWRWFSLLDLSVIIKFIWLVGIQIKAAIICHLGCINLKVLEGALSRQVLRWSLGQWTKLKVTTKPLFTHWNNASKRPKEKAPVPSMFHCFPPKDQRVWCIGTYGGRGLSPSLSESYLRWQGWLVTRLIILQPISWLFTGWSWQGFLSAAGDDVPRRK